MALSLTELNAVTKDYCDKKSTNIYFSDNVLLWTLMSAGKMNKNLVTPEELIDGGQRIRVLLSHTKSNSGSYGKTTTVTQAKIETENAARFRWAGYYASNALDLDDFVQCSGDSAYISLVAARIENIMLTLRDNMGTDIYGSAADGDSFLGLGNLFNSTTSTTYGEIAEDDMASWKANLNATAYAFIFSTLQLMRRTASVGQTEAAKPNLYITTEALKDAFENSLQTQARYRNDELVKAGFSNIMFGANAPVVADDKQTAGYCDALNLRYLKIKTHKDFAFTTPIWEHDKEKPDLKVANSRWIGQLVTNRRGAHARFSNLS